MSAVDEVLALWKAAEEASNRGDFEAQLAGVHEGIVLHSAAAGGFPRWDRGKWSLLIHLGQDRW